MINNHPQNICTRLTGGGDNAEAVTICQVSGGFTLCLTSVVNSSRVHWYSRSSNHRRHLPVIRTDSEICPPRHTCAPVCVCVCVASISRPWSVGVLTDRVPSGVVVFCRTVPLVSGNGLRGARSRFSPEEPGYFNQSCSETQGQAAAPSLTPQNNRRRRQHLCLSPK